MAHNIGDRVGDYQIIDVLGAGGMGKVYKVRNVISERIEAMKVLLPNLADDPDLADRFMREIKVQASLQHPNIASLHTAQRVNNQLIMLIEFVEGSTLEAVLRQGPIPVPQAIGYIDQVLQALAYAHAQGVIHRDIKPANMMLTPSGVVKLMDFGIAKLSQDRRLTQTGHTVGSLYYMSPEQIQGAQDLDPRADLYSLGVSLYEMVTNTRPFQGDSDYSIMAAHLKSQPVPPVQVDPRVPPALSDIILMAMAKDPSRRLQTAGAFRKALESLATKTPAPVAKSRRGVYMAVGSLATVAVLAIAAIQGPAWFGGSQAQVQAPPVQIVEQQPPPPPGVQSQVIRPPVQKRQVTAPPEPEPVQQAAPQPQPEAPTPAPATAPPAEDPELRDRFTMLGSRANAARASLTRMKEQQARQGLGMRGDITASEQRMENYLDEAEAALRAGDNERAKKTLATAEREIDRLESFLGR